MTLVSRVMALVLMGGMLLPGWALRDCCCSRKLTAAPVRACCAKRLAAATPLKKCCAARLKATATTTAVQSDHSLLCRCAATAPAAVDPNATRRVLNTPESSSWDIVSTTHPTIIAVPAVSTSVLLTPPPIQRISAQIRLCRWLA